MSAALRMRQYQRQAILSASPAQLIAKLYDIGINACHQNDRLKLRAVLQELIASLNFNEGGDLAQRLFSLYEYALTETVAGDLQFTLEMLSELRDAWREGVLKRKAA